MSEALRGARFGLVAGMLLGAIEAAERALALSGFVRGAGEALGLAGLSLFFPALTGALVGMALGACVALARLAPALVPLPAVAWRAMWGGVAALALAAFLVFALTLTMRFDSLIARWPLILAAALGGGAAFGIAWPTLAAHGARARRGAARALLAVALAGFLFVLYLVNAYFAPQSSYGIHVIFLTGLAAGAALAVWLMPASFVRRAGAWAALLTLVLAFPADFAMRNRPRLEGLVKIRTSTSARCIDLLSWLADRDGDGAAPAFLLGGDDLAPFDPARPPGILRGFAPDTTTGVRSEAAVARPRALARPHIVLLTIDALRADVVAPAAPSASFLGALRPATPFLDSLAAESAVFEAAYAPSAGTEDTFNALFSGWLAPGSLAVAGTGPFLSQRLERGGYAVSAWTDDPHFGGRPWGFKDSRARTPEQGTRMMGEVAEHLAALPPGQPGFAWIHVMTLHSDVLNPLRLDAYSRDRKVRAYARHLAHVDTLVGALEEALARQGLAGRTLIALTADHGEEFGEHGHFHHNLALYEPAIRVPLWISGPGITPRRLLVTAALEELHPTLLEAAGLDPGATPARSLLPVLEGEAPAALDETRYSFLPHRGFSRRYATWSRPDRGQAALVDPRSGRKVILRIRAATWEAYDLARDPLERDNLAGDRITWPDSMLAALRAEIERNARPPAPR